MLGINMQTGIRFMIECTLWGMFGHVAEVWASRYSCIPSLYAHSYKKLFNMELSYAQAQIDTERSNQILMNQLASYNSRQKDNNDPSKQLDI